MSKKATKCQVQKCNRNHNKTPLTKELLCLNKEVKNITFFFCDKHVKEFNDQQILVVKIGCGDLHAALPKVPLNPPGYKYLGPNNPLEKQVDLETGIPKDGNEPTNALDAIALKHDLLYYYAEKDGVDKADTL